MDHDNHLKIGSPYRQSSIIQTQITENYWSLNRNWKKTEENIMRLGPTELIIILVIVLVLFGVGRIGKIAGELGSGIRAFKEGLQGDQTEKNEQKTEDKDNPDEG